jgi:CxxC-x17-CxxC domain-containing protein
MQMHEAVCSECGSDCEVPFKPSSDKPVYCNNCFDKVPKPERKSEGKGNADLTAKFEMLNIKLDRILKALDSSASHKTGKEVKEVVKELKEFKAPAEKAAKEAPTKSVIKKSKPKVKKAKM